MKAGPLHLKLNFTPDQGHTFRLYYQGKELVSISSEAFSQAENTMEILLDKTVAEIFVNQGEKYIVKQLSTQDGADGLVFESNKYGPFLNQIEVFEMKSIWTDIK